MTPTAPTLVLAGETPVPPTSGIRLRVLHLARVLATSGPVQLGVLGPPGRVDGEPFAVSADGELRPKLQSLATALRRPYAAARHAAPGLAALAAEGTWDVVIAETPWLMPAAVQARRPVILDAHNVETDVMRSLARSERRPAHRLRWHWEALKTERWERAATRTAAAVSVTGDHEAERFERFGAREVVVVPNGVDVDALPFALPGPGTRFVYVGHYGYRPNVLAATELAREVLPALRAELPGASLELVGRDAGPEVRQLAGPGVAVAGAVPDLLPHLRAARGTIVALRAGAGTRLKVLEAMAAGVPVISTPFGVDGIDVRDGQHVLLANTPRELAAAATRVARDDALCHGLAERARRLVEERYGWEAAAAPLVALRERLGART